jgi:glutamate/tyrosine decarboxylase-like PLP-dependent enzyme
MFDRAFELTGKLLMGEELTDEEKRHLNEYNARYKLVRWLVMDKLATDKNKTTVDFQFTPGEGFLDVPVIDMVNDLLAMFNAPAEPLVFGDASWVDDKYGNPPVCKKLE